MYGSINDLGADRLAVRFWCEPTQTWVRIDCIWARNDRGYEPIVYLWIEICSGSSGFPPSSKTNNLKIQPENNGQEELPNGMFNA